MKTWLFVIVVFCCVWFVFSEYEWNIAQYEQNWDELHTNPLFQSANPQLVEKFYQLARPFDVDEAQGSDYWQKVRWGGDLPKGAVIDVIGHNWKEGRVKNRAKKI